MRFTPPIYTISSSDTPDITDGSNKSLAPGLCRKWGSPLLSRKMKDIDVGLSMYWHFREMPLLLIESHTNSPAKSLPNAACISTSPPRDDSHKAVLVALPPGNIFADLILA
jgi:hypothetical protein